MQYDEMTLVIWLYMMKEMARVSKSQFKARALEFFRAVEISRKPVVVTDRGKPVLKVVPYTEEPEEILKDLRGSVIKYKDPLKPAGEGDWEALH